MLNIECEFLKPPQAARLLGVSPDSVLTWIHSGELRAANLTRTHGKRPRWRIHRADLVAFLSRRAATPPPKPQRRRRRQDATVTEYY